MVTDDKKDVGFVEDAMFMLQNAIAAENHAIESYAITKDKVWMEVAEIVRRKRSQILYQIVPEGKAQAYCFSKHILACAMAMKELGTRFKDRNEDKLAGECFSDAGDFEAMFLLINREKKEVKHEIAV